MYIFLYVVVTPEPNMNECMLCTDLLYRVVSCFAVINEWCAVYVWCMKCFFTLNYRELNVLFLSSCCVTCCKMPY